MAETTIAELLERNEAHTESLPGSYFDAVTDGQTPAIVSVCCSDSRVSQEGMWAIEEPGWLFSVGNIGNQTKERHDGTDIVNGDLLYPIQFTDTKLAAIVGHTGCGAVTAALERIRSDEPTPLPSGVEARVETLVPIIEAGLADDRIDHDSEASLVNQLVEYNVDRQVEFLRASDSVPDSETIAGFVYDFQGIYGDTRGRSYLVNCDGETTVSALEGLVPEQFEDHIKRLIA